MLRQHSSDKPRGMWEQCVIRSETTANLHQEGPAVVGELLQACNVLQTRCLECVEEQSVRDSWVMLCIASVSDTPTAHHY
jgi:hypothetical protein